MFGFCGFVDLRCFTSRVESRCTDCPVVVMSMSESSAAGCGTVWPSVVAKVALAARFGASKCVFLSIPKLSVSAKSQAQVFVGLLVDHPRCSPRRHRVFVGCHLSLLLLPLASRSHPPFSYGVKSIVNTTQRHGDNNCTKAAVPARVLSQKESDQKTRCMAVGCAIRRAAPEHPAGQHRTET